MEPPPTQSEPRQARLDGLDGWRAVGALMVIAAHLQGFSAIRLTAQPGAAPYGVLGVDYFFGISGFVISRGLLRPGGGGLRSFYLRRFFRILPPLILYISGVSALALFGIVERHAFSVARGLTFTCDLHDSDCGGWLGDHFWSLSVEEQFYLVIPLLLRFVRPRWPVGAFVLLIGPAAITLWMIGARQLAETTSYFIVIGFGVFCGLHEDRVTALARRLPQWIAAVAILGTILLAYLPPTRWSTVINDLIRGPLIMLALMVTAFGRGWLSDILSSRILVSIGAVSYSVYLWQQLATRDWSFAGPAFYLASVAACLGFSYASYRWFEKPLINLGHRMSRRIDKGRHGGRPGGLEGAPVRAPS